MKATIYLLMILGFLIACNSSKTIRTNDTENLDPSVANDTVRIANDKLEYEIIIIDPGFNYWLASRAKPEGYYSQSFLENRNIMYVYEWNNRVHQPQRYDPNLYEMQIDYQSGIDYGYEVNYKLFNYFIYFQLTNKQRLTGFVPRI